MADRSPIPNLPPISGVQDPATRAYLEALSQAWLVRNGQTRETDEKFLTLKDLKEGFSAATTSGAGGSLITASKPNTPLANEIASIIQGLSDSIQQSRLWRLLGERIEKIEMPEWFQGRFGAEIKTEVIKEENARSALARRVDTVITNISNNVALAQQEIVAVSDQAGATASAVTSLQSAVGGATNTAQQAFSLSQTINGKITSAWTVKVDANGYVAGFGFGLEGQNGSYSSDFYVRADRFAVGSPGAAKVVPFFIENGMTYINNVVIKDASIGTAKIGDAAITSAKIGSAQIRSLQVAGNNITTTAYLEASLNTTSWTSTGLWVSFEVAPQSVVLLANVVSVTDGNQLCNTTVNIYRDGVLIHSRFYMQENYMTVSHLSTHLDQPSAGAHYYQVALSMYNGTANFASLTALATMR